VLFLTFIELNIRTLVDYSLVVKKNLDPSIFKRSDLTFAIVNQLE